MHRLQKTAEARWATTDPVMLRLSQAHPIARIPPLRDDEGFAALVRSITHQQVSMAAANTIHGRLVKTLGGKVTPRRVLNRTPEQLRAAGLSRGKTEYVLDLAYQTNAGQVEFDRFPKMPDADIIAELTAVKGIGTWTAKMFLIFHLERPDVSAPEDLGLRMAVADAYGVDEKTAPLLMAQKQAAWSPYNSVAARVLWTSRRTSTPKV